MKPSVTILSGGMDSTTLAYFLHSQGYAQTFVSFNYGQKHARELNCAMRTAHTLGCRHHMIDLRGLGAALDSSLTRPQASIPEGHYAQDNMKLTVVPNRNAIMLSIAWGIACSEKAEKVFYGAHVGDYAQYPDCREEFVEKLEEAFLIGTEGIVDVDIRLSAPFVDKTKAEVLLLGLELKVPYSDTWSCYRGRDLSCGRCGTCVERLQAFAENNVEDPLAYADREYWKQAVSEFEKKKGVSQ